MNVRYPLDTDTSSIEFRQSTIAESRDLEENARLDADAAGNIRGLTSAHASTNADVARFAYEQVAG